MTIPNATVFREVSANGPYAWPGGYPLYFVMADGAALSFKAAEQERELIAESFDDKTHGSSWRVLAVEINWEDDELYCCHTNKRIESAYGEAES